jgi:release factor glutamine methyltransferase
MTIDGIKKSYSQKLDLIDIEILIANVLKKPREFVLAYPEYKLTQAQYRKLNNLIGRRSKGEPIAYILGHKEFFGLDFAVSRHTLVPRPETEQVVEQALSSVIGQRTSSVVIDIGTGSGNIIISIVKKLADDGLLMTDCAFFAIDISKDALKVSKKNAKAHGMDKKIKFLHGDLLEPFLKNKEYGLRNHNLIITANLPYLDTAWKNLLKSTETKGLKFEPSIALYAGKDGLDAYRKLAVQLKTLKEQTSCETTVLCEIGHLQKKGMAEIFSFAKSATFKKDLAGKWRTCEIRI